MASSSASEERFDLLTGSGEKTGVTAPRSEVHASGLFHRAVHTWLFCPPTGELLLQQRALGKDSWPGVWDISSAGHVSAGEESLPTAVRELWEELGLLLPPSRFTFLFTHLETLASVQRGKPFINNEFNDVYLVEVTEGERAGLRAEGAVVGPLPPLPPALLLCGGAGVEGGAGAEGAGSGDADCTPPPLSFRLQDVEVCAVQWLPWRDVAALSRGGDERAALSALYPGITIVPTTDPTSYGRLWTALEAADASGKA